MATMTMAPTQWGRYKDIADVEPINDGDLDCLAEVSAVLKKHGKRERFGIALLHKHFEMTGDERLVEHTDVERRVLTIKPVKQSEAGPTIQTIWELGDGEDGHKVFMAAGSTAARTCKATQLIPQANGRPRQLEVCGGKRDGSRITRLSIS